MDDENLEVEDHLAAWADVLSFILLGIAILISGGVDPRRRIWGRSTIRKVLLITSLCVNIVYSAGRFIAEGVLVATGPREFLLLSVIYCLRWVWLYVAISRHGSRQYKAFKVAQALSKLKMIRMGRSTKEAKKEVVKKSFISKCLKNVRSITGGGSACGRGSATSGGSTTTEGPTTGGRKGAFELVVRRGERVFKGEPYWRGVEETVQHFHNTNQQATHRVRIKENDTERYEDQVTRSTYLVRLVEQELHANALAEICTVEFRRKIETASSNELYKKFYDVVMTVDTHNDHLIVDYNPFLETAGDIVPHNSALPRSVQATDKSDLGNVARRVAADACFYVFLTGDDVEFRTEDHVNAINECLETAVSAYFHGMTEEGNNNNV